MNYVSRDVTVIDLMRLCSREVTRHLRSANLPRRAPPKTGFTSARSSITRPSANSTPRLPAAPPSSAGCRTTAGARAVSCHPFGLSDNVVWIFPSGPKRTISQHTDFDQTDPDWRFLRALNWSAERDEEADFELNIRAVSGGAGLIVGADGVTQEPNVANLTPAGKPRPKSAQGARRAGWDAIEAYMQTASARPFRRCAVRPIPTLAAARQLFTQANCQSCHGGPAVDLQPRPLQPSARREPHLERPVDRGTAQCGHLQRSGPQRGSPERGPRIGADGFAPPSLLSLFAFPQTFFHGGAVNSLDAVLQNVAHRPPGREAIRCKTRREARAVDQIPALDRCRHAARSRPSRQLS